MNTDKVLALAREAEMCNSHMAPGYLLANVEQLQLFAVLIQQQMEAENAELRRDAERYRWLRDAADRDDEGHCYIAQDDWIAEGEGDDAGDEGVVTHWLQNDEADAAIDSARNK